MGFARGRAGAVVSDLAEVVTPLSFTARQFIDFAHTFRQTVRNWSQIEQHPVSPVSSGGVGIVGDESKALCIAGWVGPGEFGRHVSAVAGKFLRNLAAVGETRTGDRKCHLGTDYWVEIVKFTVIRASVSTA